MKLNSYYVPIRVEYEQFNVCFSNLKITYNAIFICTVVFGFKDTNYTCVYDDRNKYKKTYLGHMSGYGPLYCPWSCPMAMVGRADATSSNSTAVSPTVMVVTVIVTSADERILQTAAGEPEDQVVTCWAAAAATATVVVVAALLLWSSQVMTIIGRGRPSAYAVRRVSSPNAAAFFSARTLSRTSANGQTAVAVTAFPVPPSLPVRASNRPSLLQSVGHVISPALLPTCSFLWRWYYFVGSSSLDVFSSSILKSARYSIQLWTTKTKTIQYNKQINVMRHLQFRYC